VGTRRTGGIQLDEERPLNLVISDVSRQGPLERLVASENVQIAGSWTSDGSLLAFVERRSGTGATCFSCREGIAWHGRC
jgi:hypothetical protein